MIGSPQHTHTAPSENLRTETIKIAVKLFWFWICTITIVLCLWIFSFSFGNEWADHFRSLIFGFCIISVICLVILFFSKMKWSRVERSNFYFELAYTAINLFLLIGFNDSINELQFVEISQKVSWLLIIFLALVVILLWHIYLGLLIYLRLWFSELVSRTGSRVQEFIKQLIPNQSANNDGNPESPNTSVASVDTNPITPNDTVGGSPP